jgi:phosphoribosyl-dephospho-CoA transferase
MLKEMLKEVKKEKARQEEIRQEKNYPSLSVALFDAGKVYDLSKEELKALLQEAVYLLRDYTNTAEEEIIQAIEEWHPELLED